MEKQPISIRQLNLQPFTTFDPGGVLLVSGTGVDSANPMTISWGMFGIMWSKPVMMVMVRPTRHTWGFISKAEDFTVNWLPDEFAGAVQLCGVKSGRDLDKFAAGNMHPVLGQQAKSPVIAESILSLECRILYTETVKPGQFRDASLHTMYEAEDYHGLFYGEIVAATGIDQFRA